MVVGQQYSDFSVLLPDRGTGKIRGLRRRYSVVQNVRILLLFFHIGWKTQRHPASLSVGRVDLEFASQKLDTLLDLEQSERGAVFLFLSYFLRVAAPSLVRDGDRQAAVPLFRLHQSALRSAVLYGIEQQFLDRLEQHGGERGGIRFGLFVELQGHLESVLGQHVAGKPFQGGAQSALAKDRRAEIVGERARLPDAFLDELHNLPGLFVRRFVPNLPPQQELQLEPGRGQVLLEIVVEQQGDVFPRAVLDFRKRKGEPPKLAGVV